MSLNQALVDKILTLRPAADRIVQNSEYLVTDEWYYEVANSLFCSCFITRFDPTCQHTLGYLESFLGELEHVYEVPLSDERRKVILQKLLQIQAAYQVCPYPRSILFDSAAYFHEMRNSNTRISQNTSINYYCGWNAHSVILGLVNFIFQF